MPVSNFDRRVGYAPEKMFDLVLDVERYREFMPFGFTAQVLHRGAEEVLSSQRLSIGPFELGFETRALYHRPDWISIKSDAAAFRRFALDWTFTAAPGGCEIRASVDLLPRSLLLGTLLAPWIPRLADNMVATFEHRAFNLYGPPGA